MTSKEKKIQIALGTYLQTMWRERCKLWDKGHKKYDKGSKLMVEGCTTKAECQIAFADAVYDVYGDSVTIEWVGDHRCKLSNGVEFRYD